MDIIARYSDGGTSLSANPKPASADDLIRFYQRGIASGELRWFMVRGTGVEDETTAAALTPTRMCECEHGEHFGEGTWTVHDYRKAPAGTRTARYIGPVCDPCADGHMADYLL